MKLLMLFLVSFGRNFDSWPQVLGQPQHRFLPSSYRNWPVFSRTAVSHLPYPWLYISVYTLKSFPCNLPKTDFKRTGTRREWTGIYWSHIYLHCGKKIEIYSFFVNSQWSFWTFFKAEKGLNLDLQLNESSFFNEDWMVANVVPLDLDTGRREERANRG